MKASLAVQARLPEDLVTDASTTPPTTARRAPPLCTPTQLWHPAAGPGPRLVAELSKLTFCDGAGLAALLLLHCRAFEDDGWLRLAATTTFLRKLLYITGLDTVLHTFPTIDDAFTALAFAGSEHDTPPPGTVSPPALPPTPPGHLG